MAWRCSSIDVFALFSIFHTSIWCEPSPKLWKKRKITSADLNKDYFLSSYPTHLHLLSNTLPAPPEERAPVRRVACAVLPTCGLSITAVTQIRMFLCFDCPATPTNTPAASSHVIQSSTSARMGPQCQTESWQTTKDRRSLCQLFLRCFEVKLRSSSSSRMVSQLERKSR